MYPSSRLFDVTRSTSTNPRIAAIFLATAPLGGGGGLGFGFVVVFVVVVFAVVVAAVVVFAVGFVAVFVGVADTLVG